MWLSLSDQETKGAMLWHDGGSPAWTNWKHDSEAIDEPRGQCVKRDPSSGYWQLIDCVAQSNISTVCAGPKGVCDLYLPLALSPYISLSPSLSSPYIFHYVLCYAILLYYIPFHYMLF